MSFAGGTEVRRGAAVIEIGREKIPGQREKVVAGLGKNIRVSIT
jgi:hypothetical protein